MFVSSDSNEYNTVQRSGFIFITASILAIKFNGYLTCILHSTVFIYFNVESVVIKQPVCLVGYLGSHERESSQSFLSAQNPKLY